MLQSRTACEIIVVFAPLFWRTSSSKVCAPLRNISKLNFHNCTQTNARLCFCAFTQKHTYKNTHKQLKICYCIFEIPKSTKTWLKIVGCKNLVENSFRNKILVVLMGASHYILAENCLKSKIYWRQSRHKLHRFVSTINRDTLIARIIALQSNDRK